MSEVPLYHKGGFCRIVLSVLRHSVAIVHIHPHAFHKTAIGLNGFPREAAIELNGFSREAVISVVISRKADKS